MHTEHSDEVATARRILAWKDFVPEFLRFPLMLLIIVIYMLSGGVYMSAVTEISGSLSWIKEDILMAGYAPMTGLTIAFPLLFRILFRFPTRSILLVSAVGGALTNVILNYFWIRLWGAPGAVWATLASNLSIYLLFPLLFRRGRWAVVFFLRALLPWK